MARLTYYAADGEARTDSNIWVDGFHTAGGEAISRLSQYEDTGFLPSDIVELENEFTQLIQYIRNVYGWCTGCRYFKGLGGCGIDMMATCMAGDCYEYKGADAMLKELRKHD